MCRNIHIWLCHTHNRRHEHHPRESRKKKLFGIKTVKTHSLYCTPQNGHKVGSYHKKRSRCTGPDEASTTCVFWICHILQELSDECYTKCFHLFIKVKWLVILCVQFLFIATVNITSTYIPLHPPPPPPPPPPRSFPQFGANEFGGKQVHFIIPLAEVWSKKREYVPVTAKVISGQPICPSEMLPWAESEQSNTTPRQAAMLKRVCLMMTLTVEWDEKHHLWQSWNLHWFMSRTEYMATFIQIIIGIHMHIITCRNDHILEKFILVRMKGLWSAASWLPHLTPRDKHSKRWRV